MAIFIELFIAVLIGIFAGIFTGLTPGVHINLVSMVLVSMSGYFLEFTSPITLCAFIISMAVTHTFLDAIPSIFLGAPDEAMALGVLPGHRLLRRGMGYEAVKLTVIGSLFGLIFCIASMPLIMGLISPAYEFLKNWIGWILIVVMAIMILREKNLDKKFWSFLQFLMTGVLGLIVLNIPNMEQPLFPLLSGLFGTSMLIVSLSNKTTIPRQRITEMIKVSKFNQSRAIMAGTISGGLVSFFPGLGPAQAAIIGSQIFGELGIYSFLILIGSINTVNMVFSLATLYSIDKARNGAIVAIMEIVKQISLGDFLILVCVALIAGGIAAILALSITKIVANAMNKVNYQLISVIVIAFVAALVFYFSSWLGLAVLIVSTAMGIIPNVIDIKRSYSMGCLLLPVILYFVL